MKYYRNLMKIYFIIINVESSCAASYFCWNRDTFFRIHDRTLKNAEFIWKIYIL